VPDEVISSLDTDTGEMFACRVLPAVERDLTSFCRILRPGGSDSWFAVPVEVPAGRELRVAGSIAHVSFVHQGNLVSGVQVADGSWRVMPSSTRGQLVFRSSVGSLLVMAVDPDGG
jgi:hypothetical protein